MHWSSDEQPHTPLYSDHPGKLTTSRIHINSHLTTSIQSTPSTPFRVHPHLLSLFSHYIVLLHILVNYLEFVVCYSLKRARLCRIRDIHVLVCKLYARYFCPRAYSAFAATRPNAHATMINHIYKYVRDLSPLLVYAHSANCVLKLGQVSRILYNFLLSFLYALNRKLEIVN